MTNPISSMFVSEGTEMRALSEVKTGAELGIRTKGCKIKTAESLLELAAIVHRAYDRFYAPWATIGRRKPGPEQKADLSEWQDFLDEAGYEMSRHAKLLRNLWIIGEKQSHLKPNSANLPNSIEALATLCRAPHSTEEFNAVLEDMHPGSTAKEINTFLRQMRYPATDLDDVSEVQATFEELGKSAALGRVRQSAEKLRLSQENRIQFGSLVVTQENLVEAAVALLLSREIKLQISDITTIEGMHDGRLLDISSWLAQSSEWIAMRKKILEVRKNPLKFASDFDEVMAA